MANMSYCRFSNTLEELRDCDDHITDKNLSEAENRKRKQLIELCVDIAAQFKDEDLEEYFANNDSEAQ